MPEIKAEITGQNGAVSSPSEGFLPDFGALRDKASAMFDDAAKASETPAPVEPVAPVVEERVKGISDKVETAAPVTETPKEEVVEVAETPQQELANLADDAMVSITVDGEDVVMPWKDAKAGFSRHSKFTKSMQQLAAEKSAFEAERGDVTQLKNERVAMQQFLGNKDLVAQFVKQKFGLELTPAQQAAVAAGQPVNDPNEIATVGQVQTLAQREAQAQAQQFDQKLQETVQQVEAQIAQATADIVHREQTLKHSSAITSTLSEIFTANPVLKAIPNMEDNIRFEVMKMNPQTEADALDAFKSVAQGVVENLGQHFKANTKVAKVAAVKAKLETKTIEPSGGAAPSVQPTNYKNADGQVNWKAVTDMARNYGS